ncbi:hypothetical protein NPIL_364271, partial [Nephila pilipes]
GAEDMRMLYENAFYLGTALSMIFKFLSIYSLKMGYSHGGTVDISCYGVLP